MIRTVSILSEGWRDLSLDDACERFSAYGYDSVEISCGGRHFNVQEAFSDSSYIENVKSLLDRHGLTCSALANHRAGQCVGALWDPRINKYAPEEFANSPEEIRTWAIEEMKMTARAAAAMDAPVVTGFMGSPIWRFFYPCPEVAKSTLDEGYEMIRSLWQPILDAYQESGIKFALEVQPSQIAYDYHTLKRVFELFEDHPALGITFNPAHLFWQGIQPELLIRDFPDKIYFVHIRDAALTLDGRSSILGSHLEPGNLNRGWNFRAPGHGEVNFEAVIRELNHSFYTGPLSLDWEDSEIESDYGAREACSFLKGINYPSPYNQ